MLIQLHDLKNNTYLVIDTDKKTNSNWFIDPNEAILHATDFKLVKIFYNYSIDSFIRDFSEYEVTEINPLTEPYEYW